MTSHSGNPLPQSIADNPTTQTPTGGATTAPSRSLRGRLLYWWSWFVASTLLAVFAPPALLVSAVAGRRHWVYPWAFFGGRTWLRLSGVKVEVRGRELLDPQQSYVFIANHKSYLDTATLFCFVGRRIGLIAKKELLKAPILGYGMGYVNVMAIDRSNRERALQTMEAATARLRNGISFGVFAEGTRAQPGEFLQFKKGAFYMAAQAGVPIVPVAIKHTDILMGKGTGVASRGTIEMVLLAPVETNGVSTDVEVQRLLEQVQELIGNELGMNQITKRR